MSKRKVRITGTYTYEAVFEIDEDNPKLKELMDSFSSTIFKVSKPEQLCEHMIHNYYGNHSHVAEGIGTEEEAEECGLRILDVRADDEFEEEEL